MMPSGDLGPNGPKGRSDDHRPFTVGDVTTASGFGRLGRTVDVERDRGAVVRESHVNERVARVGIRVGKPMLRGPLQVDRVATVLEEEQRPDLVNIIPGDEVRHSGELIIVVDRLLDEYVAEFVKVLTLAEALSP